MGQTPGTAQSAGSVEYTDSISAKDKESNSLGMILNNLIVRL